MRLDDNLEAVLAQSSAYTGALGKVFAEGFRKGVVAARSLDRLQLEDQVAVVRALAKQLNEYANRLQGGPGEHGRA